MTSASAGSRGFTTCRPGHYGLTDLRGIQHAIGGPVGIDAYSPRAGLRALRRRALALVGNAQPLPLAPEVGVGFLPWLPPLDAGDDRTRERDHLLTLLAAGVRGFNLYMAVERDRLLRRRDLGDRASSSPTPRGSRPLIAALAEVDWTRRCAATRRSRSIDSRADARFGAATSVADPLTPVLAEVLGLGPAGAAELGTDADAITARRWQTALAAALELAQVPYVIVDDAAPEDELARYRAVIVPTTARVDRGLWQRLRALAEHKRAIVVLGPGTPTHDELDQPLADPPPRRIGRIRAGSLDDLPGLAEDLAALAGELPEAWQIERPDDVRAFAFADAAHTVKLVFLVSDAARPTSAVLTTDETTEALRDPFTRERILVTAGTATLALPAHGVRLLVVDHLPSIARAR